MLWYHGTRVLFEQFDFDVHRQGVDDWNVFLGVHFAANPDTATGFSRANGRVITARLHGSFYDAGCESAQMTPEAAAVAFEHGLIDGSRLEQLIHDDHLADADDKAEASALRQALASAGAAAISDPAFERVLSWALGADDRLARAVAACYREHLEAQGYAGVLYENAYEGGGMCAIAFRPSAIEIVDNLNAREFDRQLAVAS